MKKTTSFHLEEDILEEIESYKTINRLSSRNVALERMLLERRNFLMFLEKEAKNIDIKYINTDINKEVSNIKKEESMIGKSVGNSMANMPD
ncbi:hypothetical protein [Clostridium cuniculi]|uniref:hypothetical protein n=1 Tax=Clostridium cuniculi TaxID=2548455 RepID=UPI001054AA3E|nr:hypothetical protein [Clostridium cuniculi]